MANTESYVTIEGDTVDMIAFKRLGSHGMENAIWEANPGLAAKGPILPAGTIVRIPVPNVVDRKVVENVWGASE